MVGSGSLPGLIKLLGKGGYCACGYFMVAEVLLKVILLLQIQNSL